jgi:hypothetical protein
MSMMLPDAAIIAAGAPELGEIVECADYPTGTLEGDTTEFVIELLGM